MKNIEIKPENLKRLIDVFSKVGCECLEIFFNQKANIKSSWAVVSSLNCQFDFILTMGSASHDYKTVLAIGSSKPSLCNLLGQQELQPDEVLDVLGEFANNYYGMLADEKTFTNEFGILIQSLPILYAEGQTLLSFIWGVEGKIYFGENDDSLYFGYAIQKQE